MMLCFHRGKRLAKKYYDKLFKEYCIADLSRYKENKVLKIFCHFTWEHKIYFGYFIVVYPSTKKSTPDIMYNVEMNINLENGH